jgi:hypothetical protein
VLATLALGSRELALKLGGASGTWANAAWTTCTIGGAVVKMTSYHSMATDVKNAGANWVDREVIVDQGVITSRNPGDLEAFLAKIIEEIGEVLHEERAVA